MNVTVTTYFERLFDVAGERNAVSSIGGTSEHAKKSDVKEPTAAIEAGTSYRSKKDNFDKAPHFPEFNFARADTKKSMSELTCDVSKNSLFCTESSVLVSLDVRCLTEWTSSAQLLEGDKTLKRKEKTEERKMIHRCSTGR